MLIFWILSGLKCCLFVVTARTVLIKKLRIITKQWLLLLINSCKAFSKIMKRSFPISKTPRLSYLSLIFIQNLNVEAMSQHKADIACVILLKLIEDEINPIKI